MTRYTVVWDSDVEVSFINAWIAGTSLTRAILSEVANWLDTTLAEDPDQKGQPRTADTARQIDIPIRSTPAHITAIYQVVPEDRLVRVIRLVFCDSYSVFEVGVAVALLPLAV
jgi:hypothetical protein